MFRYNNEVEVDKKVYKNVKLFMENKKDGDDLFDRLNTSVLNQVKFLVIISTLLIFSQYLTSLMDGLTAKVFRTYNASFTLQVAIIIFSLLSAPSSSPLPPEPVR